jgi:hypothetical protein
LRSLWLEGNPLSYAPFYRLDVLAWFDLPQLVLDGMVAKSSESTAVAMRATGEVPLAWQIMAQYVSQRQLLWRPREVGSFVKGKQTGKTNVYALSIVQLTVLEMATLKSDKSLNEWFFHAAMGALSCNQTPFLIRTSPHREGFV